MAYDAKYKIILIKTEHKVSTQNALDAFIYPSVSSISCYLEACDRN